MIIKLTTSKKKNPLSPLIRMIENRKFSHVVLNWYDAYLQKEVYFQSNMKGIIYMGESLFNKQNEVIEMYSIHTEEYEDRLLRRKALDLAGYDYDIPNLFKSALNKFLHVLKLPEIQWKSNGMKKSVCSEMILHLLYPVFGDKIVLTKPVDFYSPSDLEKLLNELCEKEPRLITKIK